jgi:hypothetical protein
MLTAAARVGVLARVGRVFPSCAGRPCRYADDQFVVPLPELNSFRLRLDLTRPRECSWPLFASLAYGAACSPG